MAVASREPARGAIARPGREPGPGLERSGGRSTSHRPASGCRGELCDARAVVSPLARDCDLRRPTSRGCESQAPGPRCVPRGSAPAGGSNAARNRAAGGASGRARERRCRVVGRLGRDAQPGERGGGGLGPAPRWRSQQRQPAQPPERPHGTGSGSGGGRGSDARRGRSGGVGGGHACRGGRPCSGARCCCRDCRECGDRRAAAGTRRDAQVGQAAAHHSPVRLKLERRRRRRGAASDHRCGACDHGGATGAAGHASRQAAGSQARPHGPGAKVQKLGRPRRWGRCLVVLGAPRASGRTGLPGRAVRAGTRKGWCEAGARACHFRGGNTRSALSRRRGRRRTAKRRQEGPAIGVAAVAIRARDRRDAWQSRHLPGRSVGSDCRPPSRPSRGGLAGGWCADDDGRDGTGRGRGESRPGVEGHPERQGVSPAAAVLAGRATLVPRGAAGAGSADARPTRWQAEGRGGDS